MVAGAVAGFVIGTYLLRTNPNFYIRPIYWVQTLLGAADVDAAMSGYGHDARDLLSTRVRYLAEWVVPAGIGSLLAPELLIASSPLFIYLFTRQDEWASWEGPYIHWTAPALALVAAAATLGTCRILSHRRLPRWLPRILLPLILIAEITVLFGHPRLSGDDPNRSWSWDRNDSRWERYIAAEVSPWQDQVSYVTEAHRLVAQVPHQASVMADDGRGNRDGIQASVIHLLSGRNHVYSYQQEEISPVDPGAESLSGPLLPQATVDPTWALLHRNDEAWIRRTQAAGLTERDRGGYWILFGPKD